MAEKSTLLSKKLISLKTFNTFPSTKSKENKKKLDSATTSFDQTQISSTADATNSASKDSATNNSESTECLARKTSLFSSRFSNGGKSEKLKYFTSKSTETRPTESKSSLDDGRGVLRDEKSMDYSLMSNQSNKSGKSANSKLGSKSSIKSSSNKYTSFFTSSIITSTAKSTVSSAKVKPPTHTSTLSTIVSASSSLSNSVSNSPTKKAYSIESSSLKQSNPGFNSLPKKLSKKKMLGTVESQWHTDSQLSNNSSSKQSNIKSTNLLNSKSNKLKEKPSIKSSSALKSRTAHTFNTFVKPIKRSVGRSSLKFENKKLFTSSVKPKITADLSLNDALINDGLHSPETSGLKVSFDQDTKLDRHRSNSDNARLGKKTEYN